MFSRTIGCVGIAKRVAGKGCLQPDDRADISSGDRLDFFAGVGVHLQQPTDSLAVTLGRVQRIATRFHAARIDADIGQFANVRICLDLEDET